jgi:hypothetical protein
MSCSTSSQRPLTRENIESLGFVYIGGDSSYYLFRLQQYDLRYDTISQKVTVIYGYPHNPLSYIYVSIVQSLAELRKYLQINGVLENN